MQPVSAVSPSQDTSVVVPVRKRRWLFGCLIGIVVLAGAIRLYNSSGTGGLGEIVESAGGSYQAFDQNSFVNRLQHRWIHGASSQIHLIRFDHARVSDQWLIENRPWLSQLSNLQLTMRQSDISFAGIKQLEGLKDLRLLNLMDTRLTDSSVDVILTLSGLGNLNVARTDISSAGVELIGKAKLANLAVDRSQLSPAVVNVLVRNTSLHALSIYDADDQTTLLLPQLTAGKINLCLQGQHVTNASLPVLKNLVSLKYLMLLDVELSDPELFELKDALPGCMVHRMPFEMHDRIQSNSRYSSSKRFW